MPAREIERLVSEHIAELFQAPLKLFASAWLEVPPDRMGALHDRCAELSGSRSNAALLASMAGTVAASWAAQMKAAS